MTKIQHTFFAGLFTLCASSSLLLSATAQAQNAEKPQVVRAEKLHPTANMSYTVAGVRYNPRKNVEGFTQTGRASWYGAALHGRLTSGGERFDMNKLTAAHPTLPIPSYARVTNLSNGRSVVVRINDRGPFHPSLVMDVSRGAAEQLGFVRAGTAKVRIEALKVGDAITTPKSAANTATPQSNTPIAVNNDALTQTTNTPMLVQADERP